MKICNSHDYEICYEELVRGQIVPCPACLLQDEIDELKKENDILKREEET